MCIGPPVGCIMKLALSWRTRRRIVGCIAKNNQRIISLWVSNVPNSIHTADIQANKSPTVLLPNLTTQAKIIASRLQPMVCLRQCSSTGYHIPTLIAASAISTVHDHSGTGSTESDLRWRGGGIVKCFFRKRPPLLPIIKKPRSKRVASSNPTSNNYSRAGQRADPGAATGT